MAPQLAIGGWMPRPRKLSTDSSRMMLPMESVVATISGEATLGRMWTRTMRGALAPRWQGEPAEQIDRDGIEAGGCGDQRRERRGGRQHDEHGAAGQRHRVLAKALPEGAAGSVAAPCHR